MRANTERMLSMIDSAVAGSAPFLPVRLVVFPEFAHAAPVFATVEELIQKLAIPIPNEHTSNETLFNQRLCAFVRSTKKQLLIYDPKVSDTLALRCLAERAKAGVDIRIIGKVAGRAAGLSAEPYPGKSLHVRTIIQDCRRAFLGSLGARSTASYEAGVEAALDELAAHLAQHLDLDAILAIARARGR